MNEEQDEKEKLELDNDQAKIDESQNQAVAGGAPQNALADEYLNNWKRERADFINYKNGESKRMEEFIKFSTEGIIQELIDVIDGIGVARINLPDTPELKEWTEGFDGALEKVDRFLNKFGVERIRVEGEKFDPLMHEAVEVKDKDGRNIQEVRPGYVMHGKVIRPVRVRIIK